MKSIATYAGMSAVFTLIVSLTLIVHSAQFYNVKRKIANLEVEAERFEKDMVEVKDVLAEDRDYMNKVATNHAHLIRWNVMQIHRLLNHTHAEIIEEKQSASEKSARRWWHLW